MNEDTRRVISVGSLDDLSRVVDMLMEGLDRRPEASVVGLSGELGAGKTTFVRTFLSTLGVSDVASSPTFVIRRSYPVPASSPLAKRFSLVSHVDAYRLERPEDAVTTGISADADEPRTLLLVEWPERLGDAVVSHPRYAGTLRLAHTGSDGREVWFDAATGPVGGPSTCA